jgi:Kef-type K+ transport system membrane component KefB
VPIFFVCIGARTDLGILYPSNATNREGLIISVFLIVVAILGKLSTIFSVWDKDLNRMAIGVGMIPRGEVGLVFAAIGSGTNLISPAIITSIILMVMITTFLSPSLLRSVLSKSKEEQLS